MQAQPRINDRLPGVNPGTVGPVVIGLETLTGQQFCIWDNEVKLQPSLVPVLNPQNAVLVVIKSGHQNPLEALHHLPCLAGS